MLRTAFTSIMKAEEQNLKTELHNDLFIVNRKTKSSLGQQESQNRQWLRKILNYIMIKSNDACKTLYSHICYYCYLFCYAEVC